MNIMALAGFPRFVKKLNESGKPGHCLGVIDDMYESSSSDYTTIATGAARVEGLVPILAGLERFRLAMMLTNSSRVLVRRGLNLFSSHTEDTV